MTKWLDDDEMRAWRGSVELLIEVSAALDSDLVAEQGIDQRDYGVFVQLSEAPERQLRMCDLAARLHLTPSGLTRRLDHLVKRGYVRREPSAEDGRVSMAVLTSKGLAKLQAAAPGHVRAVREQLLDHLTLTQIRQLGSIVESARKRRADALGLER